MMRDNERAALDAAREACRQNPGTPVGFLCGVFSMTMMSTPLTEEEWRMSATPLPPNREMGPADWQLLDDALVYVGVPEGTETLEHGAIRHWKWNAELWGIWCVEDRAWCANGTRAEMEEVLPRWVSGEAADVKPEDFHYEIRKVT